MSFIFKNVATVLQSGRRVSRSNLRVGTWKNVVSEHVFVCLHTNLFNHLSTSIYPTLDITPQELANYRLVLDKSTIYKTYPTTNSTHRRTPDYQRMFLMRLPAVHRDALQPMGKWYGYLQRLLVTRECPGEDPRWQGNAQWSDLETAIRYIGLSLGCSPQPLHFIISVFTVNFRISYW
jgi:hypothetical protein